MSRIYFNGSWYVRETRTPIRWNQRAPMTCVSVIHKGRKYSVSSEAFKKVAPLLEQ